MPRAGWKWPASRSRPTTATAASPTGVLGQQRIRINGATLVWEDASARGAAADPRRRQFRARQQRPSPPFRPHRAAAGRAGVAHRCSAVTSPATIWPRSTIWKGKLYTELDYVDLAGWQRWVDYPVALPRGQGAMRLWLSVAEGRLLDLTTDLALRDVRLQLARKLPELHLSTLGGRLGGKLQRGGFSASGRNVTLGLAHRHAYRRRPTSASTGRPRKTAARPRATPPPATSICSSCRAGGLPAARTHAAASCPTITRRAAGSPTCGWLFAGDADRLKTYSLQAGFSDPRSARAGLFPASLAFPAAWRRARRAAASACVQKRSGIDLPTVFAEPRVAFDTLSAQARWKIDGEAVNVDLSKVEFAGADAASSAQGSYRSPARAPAASI